MLHVRLKLKLETIGRNVFVNVTMKHWQTRSFLFAIFLLCAKVPNCGMYG